MSGSVAINTNPNTLVFSNQVSIGHCPDANVTSSDVDSFDNINGTVFIKISGGQITNLNYFLSFTSINLPWGTTKKYFSSIIADGSSGSWNALEVLPVTLTSTTLHIPLAATKTFWIPSQVITIFIYNF
jgi:hypothetical protein